MSVETRFLSGAMALCVPWSDLTVEFHGLTDCRHGRTILRSLPEDTPALTDSNTVADPFQGLSHPV